MNSASCSPSLKPFFVRKSLEDCEKEWERVMEQQFILKEYGRISLFEQNNMTAEERNWYVRRLDHEYRERNKKQGGNTPQ